MYLRYHAFGTKENLHNFKTSACCYGILFSAECLSKLIGVTVNMATALARHTTADSIVGSADSIVGSSKAISELRSYLPKVALSNANVLITGATGTGKERVAEQIHRLSARRGGPFVCINCAAIPDTCWKVNYSGTSGALLREPSNLMRVRSGLRKPELCFSTRWAI